MRHLPKTTRCAGFDHYLATHSPAKWSDFRDSAVKLSLHQQLLAEQQHLCVYCQQSIPRKTHVDDHSAHPPVLHPSHIEHIRPKEVGKFPHLTFDYRNLAVSCNGFEIDPVKPPGSPDFCGHPKDNKFDDALFLHPVEEPDVEVFFAFDVNGQIKASPRDPARANFTIDLLQLKQETLRKMREEQYQLLVEEVLNGLDIEDYLDASQPELPKFYAMLRQLFGLD